MGFSVSPSEVLAVVAYSFCLKLFFFFNIKLSVLSKSTSVFPLFFSGFREEFSSFILFHVIDLLLEAQSEVLSVSESSS